MEHSKQNGGRKLEITGEIIEKGILNMEEHYKELKKLFKTKPVPKCLQIKETLENLKNTAIFKVYRGYPNLASNPKYKWLEEYSDKTIYMFSVTNFPFDLAAITEIKEDAKKKKIALFRINKDSPEWKNVQKNKTACLYIGSSEDILRRLKEHLFSFYPTTYAMHLDEWFDPKLTITIDTWDFHDFLKSEKENPIGYLQIIEDFLWEHYQPLFGKQGKK